MLECEYGPQLGGFKELRESVVRLTTTLMSSGPCLLFFENIDSNATTVNWLMLMMANVFLSRKCDSLAMVCHFRGFPSPWNDTFLSRRFDCPHQNNNRSKVE
jgi:hypothetical protein